MNWLHRFLVPSEHNGYRPNSLEIQAVGVMLVLIMMTFAIANVHSIMLVSSNWFVSSVIPTALVTMTNDERTEEALGSLSRNALLDAGLTPHATAFLQLNCAGMGLCGTCKVLVWENGDYWERRACQIRCFQDLKIKLQ
jgi:Na+-transporting NADH:ubiquinone oxidoreductase subunit NqrF